MAAQEHREQANERPPVGCAVITVSDTRTAETDKGGPKVREILSRFGHLTRHSAIVRDEPDEIRAALERALDTEGVDAVILTGGTGIAHRDCTFEVVRDMVDMELPGFGELFRMLSWEEVGPAAMLSRAMAGIATAKSFRNRDVVIFALPGSIKAVELAMNRLIGPELPHLVWERRKRAPAGE